MSFHSNKITSGGVNRFEIESRGHRTCLTKDNVLKLGSKKICNLEKTPPGLVSFSIESTNPSIEERENLIRLVKMYYQNLVSDPLFCVKTMKEHNTY